MIRERETTLRELNHLAVSDQVSKEFKALKTKELIESILEQTECILKKIDVFFTRKIFGKVFVLNGLDFVKLMKQEVKELASFKNLWF